MSVKRSDVLYIFLDAVNGNWGDWGEFGECSEKFYCHKGHKTRKRECNNPSPREGGDPCPGTNTEKLECPTQNCIGKYSLIG